MFSSRKGKFKANAQENNNDDIRNAYFIVTMRFTEKVLRAERRFPMRVQFVMTLIEQVYGLSDPPINVVLVCVFNYYWDF